MAVTPARNQSTCGSCWAFGSTAAFEANWVITNSGSKSDSDVMNFSEQRVLNCAVGSCRGGTIEDAMEILTQQGTPRESEDSYEAVKMLCGPLDAKWHMHKAVTWSYVRKDA